jgi:hypothetical protein
MAILLDTSVLGRLANWADVVHAVATTAIAELHRRGEVPAEPYRVPQLRHEARSANGLVSSMPQHEKSIFSSKIS